MNGCVQVSMYMHDIYILKTRGYSQLLDRMLIPITACHPAHTLLEEPENQM